MSPACVFVAIGPFVRMTLRSRPSCGPFVGIGDEIGLVVGIGSVVGIGLFVGTGLVVSLTDILSICQNPSRFPFK